MNRFLISLFLSCFCLTASAATPQEALKAACQDCRELDMSQQPRYAVYDIDSDGQAEYFVRDGAGNKAVATCVNGTFAVYPLGNYKTSVTLYPSLIEAKSSLGTGLSATEYLSFSGSAVATRCMQLTVSDTEGDPKHTYSGATEADFLRLSQSADPSNRADLDSLPYIPF